MKKKWHASRAGRGNQLQGKWQPWAMGVVAAAALTVVGYSPDAHALALGESTVQSALGEPLRAEIDIPQLAGDESSSLKASVASPDAYRAAGVDYNPAVASVQVSVQRRANGRYYLRLTSNRAFNEPFVDLLLNTQWSSGRLTRNYTLLLDPPTRQVAPIAVNPTQLSAPVPAAMPAPQQATTSQAAQGDTQPYAGAPAPVAAAPAPAAAATPAAPAPTPTTESAGKTSKGSDAAAHVPPPKQPDATDQPAQPQAAATESSAKAPEPKALATEPPAKSADASVKVRAGDTAGRIAAAHKPANVSIDQMLVAMLRANPNAFIKSNVNRMRAGAMVNLPTAEQAAAVPPAQAHRTIVAQSADFNEARRKLAANAPEVATGEGRQASGKLTSQVEDKQATATSPDKLTLSKGNVRGKTPEAAVAQAREAKDTSQRLAELSRNVNDLNRLDAAATGPADGAGVPAPGLAKENVAAPAAVASASAALEAASAPVAAASAPQSGASAPETTASAPVRTPPKRRPVVVPPPAPEPSFLDMLLENPLIPAAGAGLIALLAGLGLYRARQRRNAAGMDSAFFESQQPQDSFFGASGGKQVNTRESHGTSSMMYSPSQIDPTGDVDPVAEADVYLAYGRDLQAEEILKEALRLEPQRIAIHAKLLEIYAKRRDVRAFEAMADEAYRLSAGKGPEWQHICELGHQLDPANGRYRAGNATEMRASGTTAPRSSALMTSADDEPATLAPPAAPSLLPVNLDLDLPSTKPAVAAMAPAKPAVPVPAPADNLDMGLDFSAVDLGAPSRPATLAAAPASAASDTGALEFDLAGLSLDIGGPEPVAATEPGSDDPLSTKLALAQEFHAIGDTDGARSLVREVMAEASGSLKSRAERLLAEMA